MDEKKVNTDIGEDGLRDIARGTVRFSIKADDTLENLQVHAAFKEFCRVETDNNYTQGLRKLLEYYQADYKNEMLFEKIGEIAKTLDALQGSVVELQKKPQEENEEDAF